MFMLIKVIYCKRCSPPHLTARLHRHPQIEKSCKTRRLLREVGSKYWSWCVKPPKDHCACAVHVGTLWNLGLSCRHKHPIDGFSCFNVNRNAIAHRLRLTFAYPICRKMKHESVLFD